MVVEVLRRNQFNRLAQTRASYIYYTPHRHAPPSYEWFLPLPDDTIEMCSPA